MIGDSLAADTESALPAALPGWHVRTDARVGRPLAEGMAHLRALLAAPDVLALSLFTNDDPRHLSQLADAVRESVARAALRHLGSTAPPLAVSLTRAANRLLDRLQAQLAPRMQLVAWADEVARHPELVGADRVHPTPAGARIRARLYASAADQCQS